MNEKPMNTDVHPPREIARLFERAGVARVQSDTLSFLALAVLAGAFIALGTLFFVVVVTEANFGFGVNRLLGGLSFCLGLVLVVVAGAELFTGNNLMTLAWASRLITTRALLRSWVLAYVGNAAAPWASFFWLSGPALPSSAAGGGDTAVQIAAAKADLEFGTAFARGILCNALVVWPCGWRRAAAARPTRSWRFFFRSPPLSRWDSNTRSPTGSFCRTAWRWAATARCRLRESSTTWRR